MNTNDRNDSKFWADYRLEQCRKAAMAVEKKAVAERVERCVESFAALAACFGHPAIYGVTETLTVAACLGFAGAALLRESLRMGFPS